MSAHANHINESCGEALFLEISVSAPGTVYVLSKWVRTTPPRTGVTGEGVPAERGLTCKSVSLVRTGVIQSRFTKRQRNIRR